MTPTHQMTVLEYIDLRDRAWETLLQTQKVWSTSSSHSFKFDQAAKDVKTALIIYEIVQQNRPRAFQNFGWYHLNPQTPHKSASNLSLPSTVLQTPYASTTNSPYLSAGASTELINKKMASLDIGGGLVVDLQGGEREEMLMGSGSSAGRRSVIEIEEIGVEVVLIEVKSPVPQAHGVVWAL